MLKLEEQPATYHSKFTQLTKSANLKAENWILEQISEGMKVIDVGCGPGVLAKKIAEKKAIAFGVDQNFQMIKEALLIREKNPSLQIFFDEGDALHIPPIDGGYDAVVSTFMLSELRAFQQREFFRQAWSQLSKNGLLIVAEEFIPHGFSKIGFGLKRWFYKQKLKGNERKFTQPLENIEKIAESIGFLTISSNEWLSGAIRVYKFQKVDTNDSQPRYYLPPIKPWNGFKSKLEWMRCVLTGQIDHPIVEPGLYRIGNPDENSPILVSANYLLTYNRVMKDIEGLDVWLLCLDSDGVNVWCAARGNNFGNDQLVEAVNFSGLRHIVKTKTLILPQLSAGGISVPALPKDFGYKCKYGPVWSNDIKEYLRESIKEKPKSMKLAQFTIEKRLEAGISHLAFLIRKFILVPSIILVLFSFIFSYKSGFLWIGIFWVALIAINLLICIILPLFDKIEVFYKKGLLISGIAVVLPLLLILFEPTIIFTIQIFGALIVQYWLGLFCTLSFSGYTMDTSPRKITQEYPTFNKIQRPLVSIGAIIFIIGTILNVIGGV